MKADPPTTMPAISFTGQAQSLIAPGATLQKLAGGMKFTEGPAWLDRDGGFLILSDQPSDALNRWDAKNGLSVLRHPSNVTNGNFTLPGGAFLTCEQAHAHAITRTDADGTRTVLCDSFDGKKFSSPNDIVQKSDGTIWFTDPPYGKPKDVKKDYDGQWVFCFNPATKTAQPVVKDFDMPNGLCFSPDEKKIYIADSGKPHHVRVLDIYPNPMDQQSDCPWRVDNSKLFCVIDKGVPDGMRCDSDGRLWCTSGDSIQIFSPDGTLFGKIMVPECPANLCFGGPNGTTLFIAARTSLYSIETVCKSGQMKTK